MRWIDIGGYLIKIDFITCVFLEETAYNGKSVNFVVAPNFCRSFYEKENKDAYEKALNLFLKLQENS